MFWSDEDIDLKLLKQKLFTPAKTETLENRIMMAKTVHSAWDHCEFAFKPIQSRRQDIHGRPDFLAQIS